MIIITDTIITVIKNILKLSCIAVFACLAFSVPSEAQGLKGLGNSLKNAATNAAKSAAQSATQSATQTVTGKAQNAVSSATTNVTGAVTSGAVAASVKENSGPVYYVSATGSNRANGQSPETQL